MRHGKKQKHTIKGLSLNFSLQRQSKHQLSLELCPTASEKELPPFQKQVLMKRRLAWKLTQNFFCLSFPHSVPAGENQRGPGTGFWISLTGLETPPSGGA